MNSSIATRKHIRRVQFLTRQICQKITQQVTKHDRSKLKNPEKRSFDHATNLGKLKYGDKKYKASLRDLKDALEHHYGVNRHHPEYHPNGIHGMTLIDLVEMLADWKAATERHEDGCIWRSLDVNEERFEISKQLMCILKNTCRAMGW